MKQGSGPPSVISHAPNQATTNRLEYLSNSINHDLGLIELDPMTAVWNNDDLAVRGKARHRLLLHRLGCGGIASRQNDQRHVTVSAARSNPGGTLRKASISLAKGSKNFGSSHFRGVDWSGIKESSQTRRRPFKKRWRWTAKSAIKARSREY